jgi:hypothetical protein
MLCSGQGPLPPPASSQMSQDLSTLAVLPRVLLDSRIETLCHSNA